MSPRILTFLRHTALGCGAAALATLLAPSTSFAAPGPDDEASEKSVEKGSDEEADETDQAPEESDDDAGETTDGSNDIPDDAGGSDGDDLLRPSTRGMFATVGLGPSIGILGCGSGGCSSAASFTQFKLEQAFGYHFSGDGTGPAIGGSISESFGTLFRLQPGFKFWWDIQLIDDVGLYLAPSGKLGYSLMTVGNFTSHGLNIQPGVEGRLVLGDRGMVFARPFALDMVINGDGMFMAYDFLIGGGATF